MRVDRGVSCCASELLALYVWDVLALGGDVLFGQAEIYQVDLVAFLVSTHQKIVGLDVSVEVPLGVDVLDSGDHLGPQHEYGLEVKPLPTELE